MSTWERLNERVDLVVLNAIRVVNLIFFIAIIFYFGEAFTGIALEKVIIIMGIFWSLLRGIDADFILFISRKILSLGWGLSLIILASIAGIFWNERYQFYPNFKEAIQKLCKK